MAHLLKSNSKRTDETQESKMPTINELIEKMRTVNEWLKTKKAMNTQMGSEIYEICNTLKIQGKQFEEGHKVELNRFFASIRQIACRTDNHELGLPCRLKILELLELRGMGWRTNLAHAQYYCKRQNELLVENAGTSSPPPPSSSIIPSSSAPLLDLSASVQQQQKPMALTTPQFSNKATDTGYGINRSPSVSSACAAIQMPLPPPPLPHLPSSSSCSVPFSPFAIPPPPPVPSGFYFVPSRSAGNFIPTVMPHNQQGLFSPTSVPLPLHHPSQFVPSMGAPFSLFNNKMQPKGVFTPLPNLLDVLHDEFAPPIQSKTSKIPTPQYREEFTIRNNDSGKVMGVKGRRVALIEEISKTVISFQKVDPKCKDRQLTIIAEEKGAIEVAKKLIAETIERNVSPERPFDGESSQKNGNSISPATGGGNDAKMPMASTPSPSQMPIQIEKGPNGSSLVVASEDPAILAAVQNALNEYLKAFAMTKKAEEGENQHGSNNDNGDDCARNEKTLLTYGRIELLEIRDKTTANNNLIEEIRQRMDALDIFVMAKNQEEGTN